MIKVVVIALISFSMAALGNPSGAPTYEQAMKLLAAVWKSPPISSMDVTYCMTSEDNTKTEQDICKIYEEAYDQLHGPKENLSSNLLQDRETTVQKNVRLFLKEQQEGGRKVIYRIRFDETCYRLDRVQGCTQTTLDSNTPFQFTFIEVMDQNGVVERFEISNESKTAIRKKINAKEKQDITKLPITGFMMIPNAFVLKMKLGNPIRGLTVGPYEVNETKIDQLCSGKLKGTSVAVNPDKDIPDERNKIEINLYKEDINKPFFKSTMVCDKEDYSKAYYTGVINPATNELLYTRICSDFDTQGFPHHVTETKYDHKDKVKYRESYQIQDIRINIPIPKEIFTFNPPEDYEIVGIDPNGTGRVIREKGGFEGAILKFSKATKTKDVETLKSLLINKSPKIRLMSLQVLEQFWAEDKEKLKEAAKILENDEDPAVREESSKVLLHLK
jgi:hypothetical protein